MEPPCCGRLCLIGSESPDRRKRRTPLSPGFKLLDPAYASDPAVPAGTPLRAASGAGGSLPAFDRILCFAPRINPPRCAFRESLRAISTARLAHRCACTCGLSTSSSSTALSGDLILGGASRLDAFSAYPGRTRLPGGAPGGTTGSPEVRPTRSSRTSVGAPQISNARNR